MSDRKRGPYFKYFRNDVSPTKVPKQTKWDSSQRKINDQPTIFELVSSLRDPNNILNLPNVNDAFDLNGTETATNKTDFDLENDDNEIGIDIEIPIEINDDAVDDATDLNPGFFSFEELVDEPNPFVQPNSNHEDLQKLHPYTNCTIADAVCMIYAFATRHNLTWGAIEDLIRLSNRIIGSQRLEPSKYAFKKKIAQITNFTMIKHFFCHKCNLYLGRIENINRLDDRFCPNCRIEIQIDTKYKKNHFIVMPIKNQLQDVLERNSKYLNFDFDAPPTEICDVHDSLFFQKLRKETGNIPVVTITFSTDGAVRFKSTKEKSVWPLQFIVNEIDLERRFKRDNMLCAAVSFGKTPNMQYFFKPFIEEIKKINAEGGLMFKLKNGQVQTVKVFPMIFTGDTPARADVLIKTQFNGYKGCSYCLHSGTLVKKQIRYCQRDNAPVRTNEIVRADMLKAQRSNQKVNGYKGVSPLTALDYFDVVWQVGIDKMHNIELGVTALMFKLFLKSEKNRQGYYIGHHIDEIDRKIKSIQLPKLIRRNLRPLSEYKYFKAHEWKFILLFVAYPLLKDFLPQRYLNHLAKLVDATHILCGSKITFEQLEKAEELLNSFVNEFEMLYGESCMVYNVHLLTHLTNCVKFIGPLPCYSNYNFEDHIGRLVSLHKGTTDVTTQICEKYLLEKNLYHHLTKSSIAREFYEEIDSRQKYSICRKVAGSLMIGNGKQPSSEEEINLIVGALNISNNVQIEIYDSMLFNCNVFYEAESISLRKRTNDSFIFNSDSKNFATIECFIVVDQNLYILVNEKYEQIVDGINTCEYSIPLKELDVCRKKIWHAKFIGPKFVVVKFNETIACSMFPNMYERN